MPRTSMLTEESARAVGRTLVPLVAPNNSTAIVASITVTSREHIEGERLRFLSGAMIAQDVAAHILDTVVPLVDRVCKVLRVVQRDFDLTVANPDAVAAKDIVSELKGESADLALVLAFLSAALNLPMRQDLAATGRLLSSAGDVGMVSGLAAKTSAAANDPRVRIFLCPDPTRDHSLKICAPLEFEQVTGALAQAAADVRVIRVRSIADALPYAYEEGDIVRSSLRMAFFACMPSEIPDGPAGQIVKHLCGRNESRFWSTLEDSLSSGQQREVTELLRMFSEYHIISSSYPHGMGARLKCLILSMHPTTRRLRISYPLMPAHLCIRLGEFAGGADDHDDLFILMESNLGKSNDRWHGSSPKSAESTQEKSVVQRGDMAVDILLQELSSESIERRVGAPIDDACLTFRPENVRTGSLEEFRETITAYYAHVAGISPSTSQAGMIILEGEVLSLVDRAFHREGGFVGAYSEATQPSRLGGMRYVLNAVADQLKFERIEKYVLAIVARAVDPRSYPEKVAIGKALLEKFKPFLPPEMTETPVEAVANVWEVIARAYVRSLDDVRKTFKHL